MIFIIVNLRPYHKNSLCCGVRKISMHAYIRSFLSSSGSLLKLISALSHEVEIK